MGNLALNNALTGVLSSQSALDVISQNIANASDENYTRQSAVIKSNRPLFQGGEFYGTGVRVEDVIRHHNRLLEERLQTSKQTLSRFSELSDAFSQIEAFLNEPSEESIRGTFSDFDQSLQSLANNPGNRGARTDLIGRAQTFTSVLKRFNRQLQELGGARTGTVNQQIQGTVNEINNIAEEIANLNIDISTAKARGGNPNDLLDSRDALVKKLAELAPVQTSSDNDNYRVTLNGYTLVQGADTNDLLFESKEEGQPPKLLLDNPNRPVIAPEGSKLKALFDLRNEIVPELTNQLNDLAVQFVDRFNDLHRNGFGLDGQTRNNFFAELPTQESGIYRLEGMSGTGGSIHNQRAGYIDSPNTVLAGNPATAEPENFETDRGVSAQGAGPGDNLIGNPDGTLTINGNVIEYDMTEDTIHDVIDRINNANNQATAYLSAENRLVIKGSIENDYELSELEDSGLLLDKANILRVGGSHRTSNNAISDYTTALTAGGGEFAGDDRIDATAQGGIELSEGTLEFASSNSSGFHVNYDTEEDSLNEIISRINDRALDVNSNIRAGKSTTGRFQLFNYEESQSISAPGGGPITSGNDVQVEVSNVDEFEKGQTVGFFENSTDPAELTKVKAVNETNSTITVNLANNYQPADNAQVSADLEGNFQVNDEASQQITNTINTASMGDGNPDSIQVKDASIFGVGDEIRISQNDGTQSETAEVLSVDTATNTIQVEDLSAPEGEDYLASETAVQKSADTNRNRSLLSAMGMTRKLTEDAPGTEFGIEGQSRRPPLAQQVASFEVADKIQNNPDLIAASKGNDPDLDGIAESMLGPGDGSNAQALSGLKSTKILEQGTVTPDEKVSSFITSIGSRSSLVQREKEASEKLVQDLKNQHQQVSGVNIDQELTKMLQYQQVYQASARMIQTTDQLTQSLLQIL